MADNKVISSNIRVYPCSNRNPESDYIARLTTEYNLVSIINRLVDMKSFCVSTFQDYSLDTISYISEFMFNVNGYLFTINNSMQFTQLVTYLQEQFNNAFAEESVNNKQSQNDTLYACICVGKSNKDLPFIELLPSNDTTGGSSSTVSEGSGVDSYLGVMDVNEEGDTYFRGVTFVVGEWIEPGERGENWQKTLTKSDADIFEKFTTNASATTVEKFILPIVQVETTEEDEDGKIVASTFSVPQDSRVKFATISNGSVRSVTIDDGVLG